MDNNEKTLKIFEDTYELLKDENRWTVGSYARDKDGNTVAEDDKRAVRWCLVGALSHCYINSKGKELFPDILYNKHFLKLRNKLGVSSSVELNDTLGYKMVLSVLEEVIRRLKNG